MIGDVATGEAAERSIGTFTSYRGGNAVSRNGISNQADQGVDGSDAISAVKDTRAKGSGHLVPLDLALYSRKSKAGGTTSAVALSASEKIAKSREFLLELAGQDPGDAHEALSLDSCYERPSHVVVSDDFLDKVGWPAELYRGLFSAMLGIVWFPLVLLGALFDYPCVILGIPYFAFSKLRMRCLARSTRSHYPLFQSNLHLEAPT